MKQLGREKFGKRKKLGIVGGETNGCKNKKYGKLEVQAGKTPNI
jgi:hypothetical protein